MMNTKRVRFLAEVVRLDLIEELRRGPLFLLLGPFGARLLQREDVAIGAEGLRVADSLLPLHRARPVPLPGAGWSLPPLDFAPAADIATRRSD